MVDCFVRLRLFVGLLVCLSATHVMAAEAAPARPNFVFIMADDLGYAGLSCYGQKKYSTPRIDQMAREGMRFTQVYAGCTVCASSRSVLMTGLHTGHTPVRGNTGGIALADSDVTVAEVLKGVGYRTACIGKWGLGEHGTSGIPNKQGFDRFFGYLHQIHAHFYYPKFLWDQDEKFVLEGNDGFSGQYTHDVIVDRSMQFLREQAEQDDPFFLYLPLTIPHYELLVPEDSLQEFRGKYPETPYTGRRKKVGFPDDYAAQSHPKAATAAMVTRMDRDVGRILDLLKELKLDENTLVFFTSDNGATGGPSDPDFFQACGPLRGYKRDLYEGGIRVPMIASWPGHIKAGSVNDHVWYFADVLPTLSELAKTDAPQKNDGLSVVPALLGEKAAGRAQAEHDYLYWEHPNNHERLLQAVRMGDWKAIRLDAGLPLELYDLQTDVGEKTNVAADHPSVVQQMEQIIKSAHEEPRPQIEPKPPAGRQYQ
ncbi:Arylsulfatase [Symmachiella macrocystis]|uniref:Arylsulfatase n=1 Tax=Symmachiella macrocystis TaxID=2527985 RepID=A0A5C6BI37_9PLAN|nr:arylsulfatase [Symmachiella macrocystis]TWU11695.1 Arylsulfatase [Symmachiella macrocystis]